MAFLFVGFDFLCCLRSGLPDTYQCHLWSGHVAVMVRRISSDTAGVREAGNCVGGDLSAGWGIKTS